MIPESAASACATYDALAPIYDRFTHDYDHETWIARLLAASEGLRGPGRRVLDVACGTGRSFEPLLRRGWDVSACDVSPAMLEIARRRAGGSRRRLFTADMRALPGCGSFDLITCLDDAVNYLLTEEDLGAALASAAGLLGPGGVYVFDTNTLLTHRTAFAGEERFARDGWSFHWQGEGRRDLPAGGVATATVRGTSGARSIAARHVQRHHTIRSVCEQVRAAGLDVVSVLGQTTGCRLHRRAHALEHNKTVFVARRPIGRAVRKEPR